MQISNPLSSLSTWTTVGLAWCAAAAGRSDARAIVRETGQSILPINFGQDTCVAHGAARHLFDTSWHNPIPKAPGAAGLEGRVYHLGKTVTVASPPAFSDINKQIAVAAGRAPTYTFNTTDAIISNQGLALDGTDQRATSVFLGPLAAGAAVTDNAPWASSVLDLHGYINFPTEGTYQFTLQAADDAAAVFLGGNGTAGTGTLLQARNYRSSITTAPGLPNPLHIDIFPVDGVAQTGWYPFELFSYNQYASGLGGSSLHWQVSGPANVSFSTYAGKPHLPVSGPNPLHQYTFNSPGVVDSAVADRSDGTLLGGATVVGGNLVTSGRNNTQAAQVGDMSFFTGSFSVADWFTLHDHTRGYQVLFCFATDKNNYLVAHPQRDHDARISVEFGVGGKSLALRAPTPSIGKPTRLFTTYDATTRKASLYLNNTLEDSQTLPFAFNLATISQKYKNIAGVSPWGDPSLNGTTNQFNLYREAVGRLQILDTYPELNTLA